MKEKVEGFPKFARLVGIIGDEFVVIVMFGQSNKFGYNFSLGFEICKISW